MVLSCLGSYHLRCLRPSLFPDSQPLVERDEIIAVLQNSISLSLSLRVGSSCCFTVLEDLQNLVWNE